jgi:hypothetical protein
VHALDRDRVTPIYTCHVQVTAECLKEKSSQFASSAAIVVFSLFMIAAFTYPEQRSEQQIIV